MRAWRALLVKESRAIALPAAAAVAAVTAASLVSKSLTTEAYSGLPARFVICCGSWVMSNSSMPFAASSPYWI